MMARANARLGRAADPDVVAVDLEQLSAIAGLEAWWFAAEVADDTGLQIARVVAHRSAALLADNAGAYGEVFARAVARRFE